jgi:predicted phage baseplate assembly protein
VACGAAIEPLEWTVRPDLLSSGPEDANFVVEMDNRGVAWVRFGDGDLGRAVEPGMDFSATYRVGNGPQGNVGAESITLAVLRDKRSGASLLPRNPLPAEGGALRERMEEVKLFAPGAIRARLERAVIADDYARIVETHAAAPGDARRPRVQRAAATLAWTGSYYEVQVAIDQLGSSDADPAMLREVERLLYRYRRIGHDIRVAGAQYVPLAIELEVCVEPARLRADVKAAVQDVLSARVLPGGELGFFYPDSRTFGDGIYLSALIAAVQAVDGVASVRAVQFERAFEGPNGELESGVIRLGPLEVARLDADPSFPEHGVLGLQMRGGR